MFGDDDPSADDDVPGDDDPYRDAVAEWRAAASSWFRLQIADRAAFRRSLVLGAVASVLVLVAASLLLGQLHRVAFATSSATDYPLAPPQAAGMTPLVLLAVWLGVHIGAGPIERRASPATALRVGLAALVPVVAVAVLATLAVTAGPVSAGISVLVPLLVALVGVLLAWQLAVWPGATAAMPAIALDSVAVAVVNTTMQVRIISTDAVPQQDSTALQRDMLVVDVILIVIHLFAAALGAFLLCQGRRPWRPADAMAAGASPALVGLVVALIADMVLAARGVPPQTGMGPTLLGHVVFAAVGAGIGAGIGALHRGWVEPTET